MARLALVTGATRGIGAAAAVALKAAGYKVVANYNGNDAAATSFTKQTGIPTAKFDVSDFAAVQAGIKKIEDEYGPIEILVNNAGISKDATLHKMTFEQWDAVIRTNLTSVFNTCRSVIEGMRARGFGRIINIGSINGESGQYGLTNYSAAKAGVHGFTKSLALESAAKGIAVNTITPGYIDTDLLKNVPADVLTKLVGKIPVGRLGQADEIARAVVFLAADEAGFITGSALSINGGMHMY
ncbi:MAG: acetoacetyl-CoA reductase [Bdellovibrionales bacterium]